MRPRPSNMFDMDHPNLLLVRRARIDATAADTAFQAAILVALENRPKSGPSAYTATDVANAAGMSRARVYQIASAAAWVQLAAIDASAEKPQ